MFKHFIKPLGDFFIALFLLIILSPIILLTAIFLFFANNGKVFFFQQRPGLNSKPFKIVKFKTMRDVFDKDGNQLPDDVRLTKVGSIVRSASLDELLQLINVLKGDMSLVGPRSDGGIRPACATTQSKQSTIQRIFQGYSRHHFSSRAKFKLL